MPALTTIRVNELAVPVEALENPTDSIQNALAKKTGLKPSDYQSLTIVQRAIDARGRTPTFRFTVDIELDEARGQKVIATNKAHLPKRIGHYRWTLPKQPDGPRPVIVGAGPGGLFAALTLAEAGWAPIVLERGNPVETRAKDVSKLYSKGLLNEDSNVCYGEGGAGTFSDGKLYTRVSDARVLQFMESLVRFGAKPDILINNRPHLGTDKLIALLKQVRARLLELGCEIRFGTTLEDFTIDSGQLTGLKLVGGETIDTNHAIAATGHSAHSIWEKLHAHKVELESRPFAVGFRIEHPQDLIDEMRYGKAHVNHPNLPAADYKLAHTDKSPGGRGVYSFCMCPGGVVVATPTLEGELCINGMSHAARSGRFANSALVVTVTPEDYGSDDLFAGPAFQRRIEKAAYDAGGGEFVAPACRVTDFLKGQSSTPLGSTSYRRGLTQTDLTSLYPKALTHALQKALTPFDKKMRGYVTKEATLIGVETRTASPIRVVRDSETLEASGAKGLYPCGEGMGYGGGISSAAVDGMRCAESLLAHVGAIKEEL